MLKSNKVKNGFQLPKISPACQYILPKQQLNNHHIFSTIRSKRSDSCLKQNSAPKDARDARTTTLYLDFPIGKKDKDRQKPKRLIAESPCELQVEKLTQNAMFANRAICSLYRKDVRARMFKYDEERANFMTQRVNNYISIGDQQQVLRQFIEKEMRKKKGQKESQRNYCLQLNRNKSKAGCKYEPWEKVSSWDHYGRSINQQQQSYDQVLEQIVRESKLRMKIQQ